MNHNVENLFEARKNSPIHNTSYPLSPKDWAAFRVDTPLSFDGERELAFYFHIPFCKQLCAFCEYTRMLCPDEQTQSTYLNSVLQDVQGFLKLHPDILLRGFDIGGGTPTALSEGNFALLMDGFQKVVESVTLSPDFEPSIEATFGTLSVVKLQRMVAAGIHRLSLGLQSTSSGVLLSYRRHGEHLFIMEDWMQTAWQQGIRKINLDLMYGLKGQSEASIECDLQSIAKLRPQQVTLYELRTNMISKKDLPSKDVLYHHYLLYYKGLTAMGYHARFGQNTFSIYPQDQGVSSYLRLRMTEGLPYKGFGLSAQSMSSHGVAYNLGKNGGRIKQLVDLTTFPEEFTYALPPAQVAAKYIAIAGYYGAFSLDVITNRFGCIQTDAFRETLRAFQLQGFLRLISDHYVQITPKGFKHYGAVFSILADCLNPSL